MAMLDKRRTDLRTNVLTSPYWLSSALIDASVDAVKSAETVYFSFPNAGKITIVLGFAMQIITAITSGSTITVGMGSLATDAVTTGGTVTVVDVDQFLLMADITLATPAYYGPTTANTSVWLTGAAAQTWATASRLIIGAAATVPCVYSVATNAGAITAGVWRIHMLVTDVPGM
jgi:hypothetical protein